MNTEMQKRALAAREAYLALLDLKKVVDEATRTTHAAELEAVHLTISSSPAGDITTTLRGVMENLRSTSFETALRVCGRASDWRCPRRQLTPRRTSSSPA
jgi:hypothetical protein